MFDSVRTRLTAWYTAVLSVVLMVLAFATYGILAKNVVRETDDSLHDMAGTFLATVRAEINDRTGPNAIIYAVHTARVEHSIPGVSYSLFDHEDRPVTVAAPSRSSKLNQQAIVNAVRTQTVGHSIGACSFVSIGQGRNAYRGCIQRFRIKGAAYNLAVIESVQREEAFLQDVRDTFALTIPLAILLAGMGGYFLARRTLSPVVAMSAKAERIGAANLHERLPIPNARDELGKLSISFNRLLDRLDQTFEQQRRFITDASHELRTPVAILCGEAEVSLARSDRTAEEYKESLHILRAESLHLKRLVEDLFTLARADAGQYKFTGSNFYLNDLVADSCHAIRTLALAKGITLRFEASEDLLIHGDESLLRRMLLNLLDNAVKYTPNGGFVSVACRQCESQYVLSVSDTGCGIPSGLQTSIFERFRRANLPHSKQEGGAGLGLCISRWIAEMHQGRLELTSSRQGSTTFTVYLPVPLDLVAQAPVQH